MITRYRLEALSENPAEVREDLDEAEFPLLVSGAFTLGGLDSFLNSDYGKGLQEDAGVTVLYNGPGHDDAEALRSLVKVMDRVRQPGDIPKRIVREEHIRESDTAPGFYEGRRVVELKWMGELVDEVAEEKPVVFEFAGANGPIYVGPLKEGDEANDFATAVKEMTGEGSRFHELWDPDTYLVSLERQ